MYMCVDFIWQDQKVGGVDVFGCGKFGFDLGDVIVFDVDIGGIVVGCGDDGVVGDDKIQIVYVYVVLCVMICVNVLVRWLICFSVL